MQFSPKTGIVYPFPENNHGVFFKSIPVRLVSTQIAPARRSSLARRPCHLPSTVDKDCPNFHFVEIDRYWDRLHSADRDRHETALGADGSLVPLSKGADPISESAGWRSPQERVNSRCRETIPVRHPARFVSRACLLALGLFSLGMDCAPRHKKVCRRRGFFL